MTKFQTDKISHGYLPTYLEIAAHIGIAANVCELGVLDGGSLTMWQALFPNGIVAGVDNSPNAEWPAGTKKIVANQNSVALPIQLQELAPEGWDMIIDDASHEGVPTRQSWELLWPLVKPGGWYIIEDWFVGMPPWSVEWGTSMLRTAESFLKLFSTDGVSHGNIAMATYKHGMIILRKYPREN